MWCWLSLELVKLARKLYSSLRPRSRPCWAHSETIVLRELGLPSRYRKSGETLCYIGHHIVEVTVRI